MDEVKLLNRTDTKFVLPYYKLVNVLEKMQPKYRILQIDNKRTNSYETIYFDTPDFELYRLHHNGKRNRRKLRFRKYIESGLCFLEIKFKNNKGRTIKSRTKVKDLEFDLSENSKEFISKNSPLPVDRMESKLLNNFTRLTFVNNANTERLTIDLSLKFKYKHRTGELQNIVIAELKRDGMSSRTDFIDIVRSEQVLPMRISKYCIGATLLYDDLKKNTFKPKLLMLKKIQHGTA